MNPSMLNGYLSGSVGLASARYNSTGNFVRESMVVRKALGFGGYSTEASADRSYHIYVKCLLLLPEFEDLDYDNFTIAGRCELLHYIDGVADDLFQKEQIARGANRVWKWSVPSHWLVKHAVSRSASSVK